MPAQILFLIGLLSRIIPHVPNATGIICASLAIGTFQSRNKAFLITLLMWIISDIALSFMYESPIFGSWTLFTYSGALGLTFMGSFLTKITLKRTLIFLLFGSFLFWLWTNFSIWLLSEMYLHTFSGLIAFYVATLPFLKNQFGVNVVWLATFTAIIYFTRHVNAPYGSRQVSKNI